MRSARWLLAPILLLIAGCRPTVTPPPAPTATVPPSAAAPTVQTCPEGQSPSFSYGFAALKARLGDTMGNPVTCERAGPNGDALQQTTTGVARYDWSTNTPTFTKGVEHWALTERGLVHWTGSGFDPPSDAEVVDGARAQPTIPPPPSASNTPVNLRLTFAADDVRTYVQTSHLTFNSSLLEAGKAVPPLVIEARYSYHTLQVFADESADVLATIEHFNVSGDGQSMSVPELSRRSVRMRMAPDGSHSDAALEQGGQLPSGASADSLADSMILFRYPDGPLVGGDSFERDLQVYLGPNLPRPTLRSTYAFTGLGSIESVPVARLEETTTLPLRDWPAQNGVSLGAGEATVHGWHYVGVKDGWPVSGNGVTNMKFDATGPTGATGSFTIRLESEYELAPNN